MYAYMIRMWRHLAGTQRIREDIFIRDFISQGGCFETVRWFAPDNQYNEEPVYSRKYRKLVSFSEWRIGFTHHKGGKSNFECITKIHDLINNI